MEKNVGQPMPFERAYSLGKVLEKSSWHPADKDNNDIYKKRSQRCFCNTEMTDTGGSYTKVLLEYNGNKIFYYHQKPVYEIKENGDIIIANPHYKKKKVREEIEDILPSGYNLKEIGTRRREPKKRTWYITEPKFDKKQYYQEDGAVQVDDSIKIPEGEPFVKNL